MSLGLMQPYLFPYLGYFQLIKCVDVFVFYDNVQYIKRGWMNRNRIYTKIEKNKTDYFTFSVAKDDQKKKIDQRFYCNLKDDCDKLKRILFENYRKASNFEEAYRVIENILQYENDNVAEFNMNSIYEITKYLGIDTEITYMSGIKDEAFWHEHHQLDMEEKVIHICEYYKSQMYVNAIGGRTLYNKDIFEKKNIELKFIKMDDIIYPQLSNGFTPNLSIIDVIMHNKVDKVNTFLDKYRLI